MSGRPTSNIDINFEEDESYSITVTPETHWDREWYLPFQEYRAKLVLMLDQLLDIIQGNDEYSNFTFDGQTIPIEDYLEIRPDRKEEIEKYVKEGRLSIGPWYCLPDEYLVSGESIIRNLLLGHKISRRYGRTMKAGYVPDPFGHIAQMPQILAGFNIPSILFSRGFGNEFEDQNLDMEFYWNAPGKAAQILGIHLVLGYGSACNIGDGRYPGNEIYESAHQYLKQKVKLLSQHTATSQIILNNGTDHHFAKPHIPDVVSQWNKLYKDSIGAMKQADFEYYVQNVLDEIEEKGIELNEYTGELHGGKYQPVLSGVFSARMWIKQWNKQCETRLQKYTEPFSTITWLNCTKPSEADLPKTMEFHYPDQYIWGSWKWLLKNHPHDSICGSSVDHVHDEDMRTRFIRSEQMAFECFKNSAIELSDKIAFDMKEGERFPIFIYNPLPRKRKAALVKLYLLINEDSRHMFSPEDFCITDADGNKIFHYLVEDEYEDRYIRQGVDVYSLNFIVEDLPAMGIKTYYIVPGEQMDLDMGEVPQKINDGVDRDTGFIENRFFKIFARTNGTFDIYDKELEMWFKSQAEIEDCGDWGDLYDFSGPMNELGQQDESFRTTKYNFISEISIINNANSGSLQVQYDMLLPAGLTENRKKRSEDRVSNLMTVTISLNSHEKKIFISIDLDNQSKDHRLRVIFKTGLLSAHVNANGHFMVVQRDVDLPPEQETQDWVQPPVATHHHNDFVSVSDEQTCFTVMDFGLPEYEAYRTENGINIAITLIRGVGWLSRDDFKTRFKNQAGPPLKTPSGQCLGEHSFNLALTTGRGDWMQSKAHLETEEFIAPPEIINPISLAHHDMRMTNTIVLRKHGLIDMDQLTEGTNIPEEFSECALTGDSFKLIAFKKAEDGNDLIIRLVNLDGKQQNGELKLRQKIQDMCLVDLNEQRIEKDLESPAQAVLDKIEVERIDVNRVKFSVQGHVLFTIRITVASS